MDCPSPVAQVRVPFSNDAPVKPIVEDAKAQVRRLAAAMYREWPRCPQHGLALEPEVVLLGMRDRMGPRIALADLRCPEHAVPAKDLAGTTFSVGGVSLGKVMQVSPQKAREMQLANDRDSPPGVPPRPQRCACAGRLKGEEATHSVARCHEPGPEPIARYRRMDMRLVESDTDMMLLVKRPADGPCVCGGRFKGQAATHGPIECHSGLPRGMEPSYDFNGM